MLDIYTEHFNQLLLLLRKLFEQALDDNSSVLVKVIDHPMLKVPDFVRPKPGEFVVLEYGRNMHIPIPDLKTTDRGIEATLSFARTPYLTFVPWEAVVSISTLSQPQEEAPVKSKRPKLTLVP